MFTKANQMEMGCQTQEEHSPIQEEHGDNPDVPRLTSKQLASLRFKAMNLLAVREHSQQEMFKKLSKTCADESTVLNIIHRLTEQGLQSDERFAQAFVRARRQKGYGPSRILQELRMRGLSDDLIEQALNYSTAEIFDQAFAWAERRYKTQCLDDPRIYRRAYAALARRGFYSDVINSVLKALKNR